MARGLRSWGPVRRRLFAPEGEMPDTDQWHRGSLRNGHNRTVYIQSGLKASQRKTKVLYASDPHAKPAKRARCIKLQDHLCRARASSRRRIICTYPPPFSSTYQPIRISSCLTVLQRRGHAKRREAGWASMRGVDERAMR